MLAGWLVLAGPAAAEPVSGVVIDAQRAPVPGAEVTVSSAQGAMLLRTVSGQLGEFQIGGLPPGAYVLQIAAKGFEPRSVPLAVPVPAAGVEVSLSIDPPRSAITVSAERGAVGDPRTALQVVSSVGRPELAGSPLPTVASALEGSAGVLIQETTPGQSSPFLRGLTGYQTLILVDGVRFNTSTFRSGPNQYLGFLEPNQVETMEAVLGPASANYGSDALSGSLHLLTRQASFGEGPSPSVRAEAGLAAESADLSVRTSGQVSVGNARVVWLVGGSRDSRGDLRTGQGLDSRNVFHRFLGLEPEGVQRLLGSRLQGTSFDRTGAHSKLAIRPSERQSLTFWFQRGGLQGVRSYRDQLGGLGRWQAALEPQGLQLFYLRHEILSPGGLDSLASTFSVNSQRDGSVRQGLLSTGVITRDRNRVDAFGYTAQAATHLRSRWLGVFGGEVYRENVFSVRREDDPRTGRSQEVRALYPNGSRYTTAGLFSQNTIHLLRERVRVSAGARWTLVRARTFAGRNRDLSGASLGVTDTAQTFRDATFHSGVSWQWTRQVALQAMAGRGFRAPNMNDLGAVGLTGLGFEIPALQAMPYRPLLSRDAGEGALTSGAPLRELRPETSINYEAGVRVQTRGLYLRTQGFWMNLYDPIVRRTLLFPAANPPAELGGVPVTVVAPTPEQRAQGVVAVATALDPRAVKAFVNDGQSRYYGWESLLERSWSRRWSVRANYSYLVGRDLSPNRPARRLPPQQGRFALRCVPSSGRWWWEAGVSAAGAQRRLNPGDVDDERIGASRRRSDIASFFAGSVVAPYLNGGVFVPTGETLRQIQDRVLPLGAVVNGVLVTGDGTRVPLFRETAGWLALDVRGGVRLRASWDLSLGATNLLDRSYRVHGSGIDAPGVRVFAGLRWRR